MNSKKAKALRKAAKQYTQNLPETAYTGSVTRRLSESTRGAYRALKSGRFVDNRVS